MKPRQPSNASAVAETVPSPSGSSEKPERCDEALQCKECRERYPLEARYVCDACFGPLEVSYDFSSLEPGSARRRVQAGPQSIWRYADFLPFERRPQTALEA